jgi:hypothetical protein
MTVKSLLVLIGVDVAELEAGLGKIKAKLEAHEKEFRKIGLTMTAIGGVMTAFFAKSISEAVKAEAAEMKLRQALSNVEGASKTGADMLLKYAEALQQTTGIEDEEIKISEARLATFGLNEKQIAALIPRILDMATARARATGEEINLAEATMAVGRAVTGHMDLLGRQGVVLSEETKRTGDFNLMLKDLDKAFGGAAVAAGQTFAGQMKILKVNIGETMETIGARLIPVLLPLVTKIGDITKRVLDWIDAHQGLMKTLVPILAGLGGLMTILGPMVMIFPKVVDGVISLGKNLFWLATNPVALAIGAVGLLALTIYQLREAEKDEGATLRQYGIDMRKQSADVMDLAAKKAGLTAEAYKKLLAKYHEDAQALKISVMFGKEELISKKNLAAATEEYKTKLEKQKKAQAGGTDEFKKFLEGAKKLPPVLENISTTVAAIPFQWDKWNSIITIFEAIKNAGSVTFSFIGETSKNTILKLVDDIQYGKDLLLKLSTDIQELMTGITETGLSIFGDFVTRSLEGFMIWGEGHKNILKAMGEAFSGFVKSAITGIGQLMTTTLMASAKEILAKKAEAIAHAISSVMKSVPFPLNLVLAGVAIAGVTALFSKIKAFGEGGIVTRPTLAMIGERGPEAVLPIGRFGMAAAGAGGSINFKQYVYFSGDIRTAWDIDEISEKLARKTQEAIQRGRR